MDRGITVGASTADAVMAVSVVARTAEEAVDSAAAAADAVKEIYRAVHPPSMSRV